MFYVHAVMAGLYTQIAHNSNQLNPMADYIESWRVRKRMTKLEIALRSIASNKRATPAQQLRACELLIELERDRVSFLRNKPVINEIQELAKANVALGLSIQHSSHEINNLAPNSSND